MSRATLMRDMGSYRDNHLRQNNPATFPPSGLPSPVHASQPGVETKSPLLPWVMSQIGRAHV